MQRTQIVMNQKESQGKFLAMLEVAMMRVNYIFGTIGGLEARPKTCLTTVVTSYAFEWIFTSLIMSHAIFMGYASDYAIHNIGKDTGTWVVFVELSYTCVYMVEIALKLIVYRCEFFLGNNSLWNMFDSFLVFSGIVDQITIWWVEDDMLNLAFIRALRLFKVIKLMRVIRVMRAFRGLRLIMMSIISSVPMLFWTVVLVITVAYLFALGFHQAVVDHLTETPSLEASKRDKLIEYWGTVGQSMLSLYWSGMGGESWRYVAAPLADLGTYYLLLFWFYILFYLFVTFNIITALFLEVALKAGQRDHATIVREELAKKQQLIAHIQELWRRLDVDGSGGINVEEMIQGMNDPTLLALFSRLGIDVMDVGEFFRLLSNSGTEVVDADDFLVGCMKLMGNARSMDMMALMHWHAKLMNEQRDFQTFCESQLQCIQQQLLEQRATGRQTNFRSPHQKPLASDLRPQVSSGKLQL